MTSPSAPPFTMRRDRFRSENYERLKESGYTRLIIPESLGGLGATMLERIKAQERLAQGCGATVLAINMHFNTVGLLVDLYRKFKAPNVEHKLRRIASARLICGGSGSEPDNAIIALRPRTRARRVDGGWLVNGRKIFGLRVWQSTTSFSKRPARKDRTGRP